jgi:hypothetical protein
VTAVLSLFIGVLVAVCDPFAGKASGGGGVVDNGAPTGLVTMMRRSLTSQTAVSGTLGYAGSWTVAVPAGTSATDLQQATQQQTSRVLPTGSRRRRVRTSGRSRLPRRLQAARLKGRRLCRCERRAGANAGGGGGDGSTPSSAGSAGSTPSAGSGAGASSCASSMQTVTADQAAVATAEQKVAVDRAQLVGARSALASAQHAFTAARSDASSYSTSASYTMLPAAGKMIRRGQALYAINGSPTLLLYAATPSWRSFTAGMSPGRDVAELNANLRASSYEATVATCSRAPRGRRSGRCSARTGFLRAARSRSGRWCSSRPRSA